MWLSRTQTAPPKPKPGVVSAPQRALTAFLLLVLVAGFACYFLGIGGRRLMAARVEYKDRVAAPETPASIDNDANAAFACSSLGAFDLLSTQITLRQFLESYYGRSWESIETHLDSSTIHLDETVNPTSIHPWPEVKEKALKSFAAFPSDASSMFDRTLAWGEEEADAGTSARMRGYDDRGQKLPADELAEVQSIVSSSDAELRTLASEAATMLDVALREVWDKEQFVVSPLVALKQTVNENRKLLLSRTLNVGGWIISVSLYAGDSPEYDQALTRIRLAKARRAQALKALIRTYH